MSPGRRFLLLSAVLVGVAALTYLASEQLDSGDGSDQVVGGDGRVQPGAGTTTTTSADPDVVPAEGQTIVTGTVVMVHLDGAVIEPRVVPTPLTVISDRGFGNGGEMTSVLVDGAASTIVWDGGRPLVLSSGGSLVLDPLTVTLADDGIRLVLGGGAHALTPGTYRLDTPVAVGTSGIATPRDGVSFDAVEGSLFEASGDAALVLGPDGPHRFVGPGTVRLTGDLEVTDASGTRAVQEVAAEAGAFDLTLSPAEGGGWTVMATVQAAVRAG